MSGHFPRSLPTNRRVRQTAVAGSSRSQSRSARGYRAGGGIHTWKGFLTFVFFVAIVVFVPSWRLRAVGGERVADDFLVVADVEMPVGVRRVHPVDVCQFAAILRRRRRLDHLRPADLLVPFRTELPDHQLSTIVV